MSARKDDTQFCKVSMKNKQEFIRLKNLRPRLEFLNLIIHPTAIFFNGFNFLRYRSTHSCTNISIWGYFGVKIGRKV